MTTANLMKTLLIAALLVSSVARAADGNIQVAMEDGKTRAEFKLAGANCVLVDDKIRCSK